MHEAFYLTGVLEKPIAVLERGIAELQQAVPTLEDEGHKFVVSHHIQILERRLADLKKCPTRGLDATKHSLEACKCEMARACIARVLGKDLSDFLLK